jgi:hypothetical protein
MAEAGDYLACFAAPDHRPPVTIAFEFDWRSGVYAKGWGAVAIKKEQVDVRAGPPSFNPFCRFCFSFSDLFA